MVRQKSQTNGLSKVVQYELAVGIHLIEPVQTKLSIPQCGQQVSVDTNRLHDQASVVAFILGLDGACVSFFSISGNEVKNNSEMRVTSQPITER